MRTDTRLESPPRHALSLAICVAALPFGCSTGGHLNPDLDEPDHAGPQRDMAQPDLMRPEPRRLLKNFFGCPNELFAAPPIADDFEDPVQLDALWNWKNDGRFPRPQLLGGSLIYGPHNLKPDEWWNNWSPVISLATFGEVMYCVRYRIKPPSGVDGGDSMFNTSIRGGMNVALAPVGSKVYLNTRTSDTTWDHHAEADLAFKLDVEQTVEILLYGKDNRYYAEVKNVDTGAVVALTTNYDKLAATGTVGMLAWRLKHAVYVDRACAGPPSAAARELLADK